MSDRPDVEFIISRPTKEQLEALRDAVRPRICRECAFATPYYPRRGETGLTCERITRKQRNGGPFIDAREGAMFVVVKDFGCRLWKPKEPDTEAAAAAQGGAA